MVYVLSSGGFRAAQRAQGTGGVENEVQIRRACGEPSDRERSRKTDGSARREVYGIGSDPEEQKHDADCRSEKGVQKIDGEGIAADKAEKSGDRFKGCLLYTSGENTCIL